MFARGFLLFLTLWTFLACAQNPALLVQAGHTNRITASAVSGNSKYLATGSYDNLVKLWDLNTGELLGEFPNGYAVNSLCFLPDDRYLMAGSWGISTDAFKIWDLVAGTYTTMPAQSGVMEIVTSPSGKFLAVGNANGSTALYDLKTNEGLRYYQGNKNTVRAISFSPGEDLVAIATGSMFEPNVILIWDTGSDSLRYTIPVEEDIEDIEFTEASGLLVETSGVAFNHVVYKVDLSDQSLEKVASVSGMGVIGDGTLIAGMGGPNRLDMVGLNQGKIARSVNLREKNISEVAVSPDGRTLVALGMDIEIFDIATLRPRFYIPGKRWIDGMAFSAKGSNLAFSGDHGNIIHWDVEHGDVNIWRGHTEQVVDLFYDADGKYLASASRDTTVIIWNQDGTIKHHFLFDNPEFHTVSMNPSADWLAVSNGDTVYSIEVERGVLGAKFSLGDFPVDKVIYSPNNRDYGYIVGSYLLVYDVVDEKYRFEKSLGDAGLTDLDFSSDGRYIAAGGYADSFIVYDLDSARYAFVHVEEELYVTSLAFDPTSMLLAVGYSEGLLKLFDVALGKEVASFNEHANLVNELSFRRDGKVLASSSWDGKLVLWDVKARKKLASLYAFEDESWAIVDDAGRYDASGGGNIGHLHFVVDREAIALDQLKERFYEPGLLQKLLGYHPEPLRDVSGMTNLELFPRVALRLVGETLEIGLTERSGGIGRVALFINDKEVDEDLSARRRNTGDSLESIISVDLGRYARYFTVGSQNMVEVQAYNAGGYLSSRRVAITYRYERPAPAGNGFTAVAKPNLYGIVIGTSDYRGDRLDLLYADKDAQAFSEALRQTAAALFGAGNVDIQTLNTSSADALPDKEAIRSAFERLTDRATPMDVLIVYMSGHGVNHQAGEHHQFHYLTKDVESGDLSDATIRELYTISTEELTEWIKSIPVQKQVLVLDACASGRAIEDILVAQKSVTSGQVRALERLKDRTGMFVLVGSAADKVSFEASRFGQSLLTYSLLEGMKGQALRDGEFVDVLTLFEHAVDKVPELATYIGGIQKPILAIPYGGNSFDIGRIDTSVHIELASIKPVFIRSNFQDEYEFADVLGLSERLDARFRDLAARAKSAEVLFVDVTNYPEAYSIKGRYVTEGDAVQVTARVFHNRSLIGEFRLDGKVQDLDSLTGEIIRKASGFLPGH